MDGIHRRLLGDIVDNPFDEFSRSVLRDYCLDMGLPWEENLLTTLGEAIRLTCPGSPLKDILCPHNWLAFIRRGLVEEISVPVEDVEEVTMLVFPICPILDVQIPDRTPRQSNIGYFWAFGPASDYLARCRAYRREGPSKYFQTDQDARKALSRWIVDYGRREMALPPIEW